MIYEIESKADISGMTLLVRFPEEDLDEKALYTIQADAPPFLIPFRHRIIDGQVECTYLLGEHGKLLYRFRTRSPSEYVEFWEQIIQPLLDCGDWFLKAMSFVMDPQHLYTDRGETRVLYIYIPTKRDCSTLEELRSMVIELSRRNAVTNPQLENKVLRAIMEGFQPKAFLQMLRDSQSRPATPTQKGDSAMQMAPPAEEPPRTPPTPKEQPVSKPQPAAFGRGGDDDIIIDLSGRGEKGHGKHEKGLFGLKSEKKKAEKPSKKGGLFGGKREKKQQEQKEIVLGAAAEVPNPALVQSPPHIREAWTPPQAENEVTQLDEGLQGVCLRLVGNPTLPSQIPVNLAPGGMFTIGRFDVSVGHRQSDFEFDKGTKAVSRHHAVIERQNDGAYTVTDLSSSAGTFVDGVRLTPNVPYPIGRGSRISFGTSGADYIWEE